MNFLEKWLHIIRNCSFDNTYKMAQAKAVTEIAVEQENLSNTNNPPLVEIQLKDIATKVLRYYFEQTIFFDLKQSSNPVKPPVMVSIVKQLKSVQQTRVGLINP